MGEIFSLIGRPAYELLGQRYPFDNPRRCPGVRRGIHATDEFAFVSHSISDDQSDAADRLAEHGGNVSIATRGSAGGVDCEIVDLESAAAGADDAVHDEPDPSDEVQRRRLVAATIVRDIGARLDVIREGRATPVTLRLPHDATAEGGGP